MGRKVLIYNFNIYMGFDYCVCIEVSCDGENVIHIIIVLYVVVSFDAYN